MPLSDTDLQFIFEDVSNSLFPNQKYKISVRFYPYRSLRCTVERRWKKVEFLISQYYREADEKVIQSLAKVLWAKIIRVPVQKTERLILKEFAKTRHGEIPVRRVNYQKQGTHFDLQKIFDELNASYFNSALQIGKLGWSQRKSYRRLGFYDALRSLLVISRIFDSKKVPENVVRYLVYHEMLHIYIPPKPGSIHPLSFKKLEKQFPGYPEIQEWIDSNIKHL